MQDRSSKWKWYETLQGLYLDAELHISQLDCWKIYSIENFRELSFTNKLLRKTFSLYPFCKHFTISSTYWLDFFIYYKYCDLLLLVIFRNLEKQTMCLNSTNIILGGILLQKTYCVWFNNFILAFNRIISRELSEKMW